VRALAALPNREYIFSHDADAGAFLGAFLKTLF